MSDYTPTTEVMRARVNSKDGRRQFDRWLVAHEAAIRADERARILSAHREIDADNSCSDPDCCGGPWPDWVCELCGLTWPCPTVAAARGEDTRHE